MNTQKVLAENVRKLMDHNGISSNRALARRAGIASQTIDRIINESHCPTLKGIVAIAVALNVQPWQLLVPNFDPDAPTMNMTDLERQNVSDLMKAAEVLKVVSKIIKG